MALTPKDIDPILDPNISWTYFDTIEEVLDEKQKEELGKCVVGEYRRAINQWGLKNFGGEIIPELKPSDM